MRLSIAVIFFCQIFFVTFTLHATEFFCDNVTCLIAAINEANLTSGPHTIFLQPGTYTLTMVDNNTDGPNGLPSIRSNLTIRQNDQLAIIERDLGAPSFRIFHVAAAGNVTLSGLTIRRAGAFFSGVGSLFNRGTVTVLNSTIAGNFNNGISNSGTMTITNSTIAGNRGDNGAGIGNFGTMSITNSSITDNIADFRAGGIFNISTLALTNSTIARNYADHGAGIHSDGNGTTISNSTIAENRGAPSGNGAGIFVRTGVVELVNTILALNIRSHGPDCWGRVRSLGNNLIGDPTTPCIIDLLETDLTGDPALDQFTDDGTPGNGHFPLLPDSRAIDSGNPEACPDRDQIGNPRVGICDRGSIEFQGGSTTLAVDPSAVEPGGTVTATWSGIEQATARDWIGLYSPLDADAGYHAWIYVSCSQTPGSPRPSGSCGFVIPRSLPAGTYQLRFYANDGFTRLATSNNFTVGSGSGPTLTSTPTTLRAGETLTATWAGVINPSATDWIGLYRPGSLSESTACGCWRYTTGQSGGSVPFLVPASLQAGTYELRLFSNDTFSLLARGNSFTVQ